MVVTTIVESITNTATRAADETVMIVLAWSEVADGVYDKSATPLIAHVLIRILLASDICIVHSIF